MHVARTNLALCCVVCQMSNVLCFMWCGRVFGLGLLRLVRWAWASWAWARGSSELGLVGLVSWAWSRGLGLAGLGAWGWVRPGGYVCAVGCARSVACGWMSAETRTYRERKRERTRSRKTEETDIFQRTNLSLLAEIVLELLVHTCK